MMPKDSATLAALVGSRLCHDLISPVGAIQNGLELLELSGMSDVPELELIRDSCTNAAARIRFFRVAFGSAGDSQTMGHREIQSIMADLTRHGRVKADWRPDRDLPRTEVQMAFLAFLCSEAALPQGGTVSFAKGQTGWSIAASGPRLNVNAALWDHLTGGPGPEEITADKVQFAVLALLAQDRGRKIRVHKGTESLRMEIL
ncbi:histidine phosphotransferase family protein [Tropicibacter oceani]|uniref:Histidine phosphotransferase family protein n=1 Tax=Tropicibacter oceani TaxID=3058420 RepID=A0ABY8QG19_9RHOB|nr:histidine phosphotransferase family protein [Tropicibacter oceani]WGW02963.1 histidine phosphotransferase family protein [Tropicibacter oceani]